MVKLDTLKGHNVKVGDVVRFRGDTNSSSEKAGSPLVVGRIEDDRYFSEDSSSLITSKPLWEVLFRGDDLTSITDKKPDGGPAGYYDLPFKDWVTVNDMVEYLSDKQWGKHSWIFKDILKACTRFGKKAGTDEAYDAKKIIYYGTRLLVSVTDKATARKYLQQLLDDKQFKENGQ